MTITRLHLAFLWLRLYEGDALAEIPGVAQARRRESGRMVYRRRIGDSWSRWTPIPLWTAEVVAQCWPPGWPVPEKWSDVRHVAQEV